MSLTRTKSIDALIAEGAATGEGTLKRTLGAWALVALGIGAIIGAGLFVRTAAAIADRAGPSVVIAFLVLCLGCAFAGLCYAEFVSIIPIAGSAYTYSYATMGEFAPGSSAGICALEYAVGAATVAISGANTQSGLRFVGMHIPYQWCHSPLGEDRLAIRPGARLSQPSGDRHSPDPHRAPGARHAGISLRERPDRDHQGRHRPWSSSRLEVHQPGESHTLHPRGIDVHLRRKESRTITAASWASRAAGVVFFGSSSIRRRVDSPLRRPRIRRDMPIGILGSLAVHDPLRTSPTSSVASQRSMTSAPRAKRRRWRPPSLSTCPVSRGCRNLVMIAILAGFSSVILVMRSASREFSIR